MMPKGPLSIPLSVLAPLAIALALGSASAAGDTTSRVEAAPGDSLVPALADTLLSPADTVAEEGGEPRFDSVPVLSDRFWKRNRFELYDIPDPALTEALWRMTGSEEPPEDGRYQVLLFTDSTRHAYLLRAGTQVGRLPDTAHSLLRRKIRAGVLARGGGSDLWRNFWNPSDPLLPFLWKTGLEVEGGFGVTVMRNSSPQYERHYHLNFLQRPLPWLVTELGGHFSDYRGGLRRNVRDPLDLDRGSRRWEGMKPWWHVAVGVPGVKWEVALANRVLPDFYWLDPRAGEGSYKAGRARAGYPLDPNDTSRTYRDAVLVREWSEDGDPVPDGRNILQALHVKAGNLYYSAYFDSDVYRSVIHRGFFGDLPAPFGAWGFGFIAARGSGHTLLRLDIAPIRLGFAVAGDEAYLRLLPLRVDLAYRDVETFRVALSASALLDSRTFRPGDKR